MSDTNIFSGTYNTFNSRTGGTNSNVILQAGPNENLLLKGNIVGNGTFTNLIATNSTVTNLLASSGTVSSLTVGTLNGLITGLPTSVTIVQALHGFSVGNWLYLNGTTYTLADATSVNNAEVVGVVTQIIDINSFVLQDTGYVSGLSSLVGGSVYFLSTVAGLLTTIQPTNIGLVSKPLLVANSGTSGYFTNYRGELNISPPTAQTIPNLVVTSETATNLIVTSETATNLIVTSETATNLNVTSETTTNLNVTSETTTNLILTRGTISNLAVTGSIYSSIAHSYILASTATQSLLNTTIVELSTYYTGRSSSGTLITNATAGRLQVSAAGTYLGCASVVFSNNSTGSRQLWFGVNGDDVNNRYSWSNLPAVNGDSTSMPIAALFQLNANDYISVWVYQNSGSTLTTLLAGLQFSLNRVS